MGHIQVCSGAGWAGTCVCQRHAHVCELSRHTRTCAPYHTSSHQAAIRGTAGLRQKGAPPLTTGTAPRAGGATPASTAGPGYLHGCSWHHQRTTHAWGVFAASSQPTLGSNGCLKAGGGGRIRAMGWWGHELEGVGTGRGMLPRSLVLEVGTRAVAMGARVPPGVCPRMSSKSKALRGVGSS